MRILCASLNTQVCCDGDIYIGKSLLVLQLSLFVSTIWAVQAKIPILLYQILTICLKKIYNNSKPKTVCHRACMFSIVICKFVIIRGFLLVVSIRWMLYLWGTEQTVLYMCVWCCLKCLQRHFLGYQISLSLLNTYLYHWSSLELSNSIVLKIHC